MADVFELTIVGPQPHQRLKYALHAGETCVLGRGPQADLVVPWDPHISRRHVELRPDSDHVAVERLAEARNPLFFEGQEVESCRLHVNEHAVLGTSSLRVTSPRTDSVHFSPQGQPVEQLSFDQQDLRKIRFRDADKRIEVLANLPEVIWGARTDSELHQRLANLILAGVPHADAVAIVKPEGAGPEVLHWERRLETAGGFRPSGRLVSDAVRKQGRSVLHVWEARTETTADYTEPAEFDWAFCTPVLDAPGEAWGMYVCGRLDQPWSGDSTPGPEGIYLQADVKFTELIAEIMSSVQRLNKLERQQAALRQFFAPPILSALGDDLDTELLEPREGNVTVMFCDLRGFSRRAEEAADDLLGLLDRVSRALEVMTNAILEHGGVTGDFLGDAALGFWGWPFESDEAPLNACRAANDIREAFAETRHRQDHPLANFEMGIGIAHGRAVAGKIGTRDHVKVTVFGPVVNLASRLEGMTKELRVPILLDEATAGKVRPRLNPDELRLRRLAKVQPYGMEQPVLVSELLPPESQYPELTDAHVEQYELGVDHFMAGRWEAAYQCLHGMPPGDRAQDFLAMQITQHNRVAPAGWDGVIRMKGK